MKEGHYWKGGGHVENVTSTMNNDETEKTKMWAYSSSASPASIVSSSKPKALSYVRLHGNPFTCLTSLTDKDRPDPCFLCDNIYLRINTTEWSLPLL